MCATLLILCASLLGRRCYADAVGCVIPIAALGYLATSSPFSFSHFIVFAGLSLSAMIWQWLLCWRFEDSRLAISALLATVSVVICAIELGAGERFLIVSTLLGANLAFYSHAPEKSSRPVLY